MSEGSPPSSDRLSRLFQAGSAALVLNSLYLAAFATPSLFYMTNVAVHVLGGLAMIVVGLLWVRPRLRAFSAVPKMAVLLLAAGVALGMALTVTGATTRYRWLLLAHIAVVSTGTLLALVIAAIESAPLVRQRFRPAHAVAVIVLLAAAGWSTAFVVKQRKAERYAWQIVNPASPALSMDGEGAGPSSPFFPSSSNTNVNGIIPANFFMTSKTCERCHKDIYDQWNSSAHHFSSFNNQWYRKSDRVHAGRGRDEALEVVCGLPRPCRVLQRQIRPSDQRADRYAGGPGRAGVHLVPFDLARRQHHGAGRFHDRVPAAPRSRGQ